MSRFRPRMSLRLFLLAITALVVWLGLNVARCQRQQRAIDALKSAIVMWDFQLPGGDFGKWDPAIERSGPAWLAGPTGQGLFSRVEGIIATYGLSAEALARLADLSDLRFLNLSGSGVDDGGLAHVVELSKLETLNLDMTSVTDRGLEHLHSLPALEQLRLNHTGVTDDGVQQLGGLTTLRDLHLEGTQVTAAGVRRLKTRLPDCEIWWGPTSSPQGTPQTPMMEAGPQR